MSFSQYWNVSRTKNVCSDAVCDRCRYQHSVLGAFHYIMLVIQMLQNAARAVVWPINRRALQCQGAKVFLPGGNVAAFEVRYDTSRTTGGEAEVGATDLPCLAFEPTRKGSAWRS
jgi:hypothetical protein